MSVMRTYLASFLFLLCGAVGARAAPPALVSSPESVKAAFLFHFGSYVEWPAQDMDESLTIGILGADAVASELAQLVPGRKVGSRPVDVRVLDPEDDPRGVEILYVGRSAARSARVLSAARALPILLVTDAFDGLEAGGMINFVLVGNHVRFEISRSAAERAGLRLSSRLLAVALRVTRSGLPTQRKPALAGEIRQHSHSPIDLDAGHRSAHAARQSTGTVEERSRQAAHCNNHPNQRGMSCTVCT